MIDVSVEDYLHERLCVVLYQYISGSDVQRYIDSFRGSLEVSFKLNLMSVDRFVFLFNFMRWLECKALFNEIDDDMYRYFYDDVVKDMDHYLADDFV